MNVCCVRACVHTRVAMLVCHGFAHPVYMHMRVYQCDCVCMGMYAHKHACACERIYVQARTLTRLAARAHWPPAHYSIIYPVNGR